MNVKQIFNEEYDRLYDAESPCNGEREAMLLFDELNTTAYNKESLNMNRWFHEATDALFLLRKDVCSSDRECAAMIFTALRIGLAMIKLEGLGIKLEEMEKSA